MRKIFPLTLEQFNELHFNQSLSISEISRRHDIAVAWISIWAKRNGVILATRPTPAKNISEEEFRKACAEGLSQRQLATKFNISKALVYNKQREYKIMASYPNPFDRQDYRMQYDDRMQSDGYRQQMSKISSKLWTDETYKQKTTGALNSDAVRAVISHSSKTLWESKEYRDTITNKAILLWNDKDYRAKISKALQNTSTTLTNPHKKICVILDSLGIAYINEYAVGPYNFDVFIPSHNILIEVQGTYWHSLPDAKRRDSAKSTYIERYRPDLKLQYVWEHECLQENKVLEKIKRWLKLVSIDTIEINLNDVVLKSPDVKTSDGFLYDWHYQHHGRHGVDFGAYYDDKLIALVRLASVGRIETATSLGYDHSEVLELTRMCIHPKYHNENMGSWFLSRAEKLVRQARPDVKCLVSFADTSYGHTGAVYKASNWELHATVKPNYFYVDSTGWVMHKKTLWNHSKKMGMTETEYATQYGYRKQWGREKLKFIRRLVTTK
jgi:very-short-patch-repair endonuclease/transposase